MNFEFKKVFFYAILPAMIAGGFSIAPKLYDIATEPRAELTYNSIVGPDLTNGSQHEQIASLIVANTGKKALSNIAASVNPQDGKISLFQVKSASDLDVSVKPSGDGVVADVARLLPGEQFSVSFMIASARGTTDLTVAARSNEVLGSAKKGEAANKISPIEFLGPVLTAFSVFLMAISVVLRKRPFLKAVGGLDDKQDYIYYVAARVGILEVSDALKFTDESITYRRMSDILLAYGLSNNSDAKMKAVCALECLLLAKDIAGTSISAIEHNLHLLKGEDFSQEEASLIREKAVSVSEQMQLRKSIDALLTSRSAFLT